MIPRGAAAVQHRQFACRLVRQAPNWCLQFSRMGDLVRNGAPQRSLRDRNRGKTPAHARGMTTSLTLGFPAAGGHQQPTVFSRLTELAGSWDQLAVGSGSPTHHYAWVSAYADIASTSSDLHLVVVGPPQRPVAIAPLIMRRRGGGRLEQLGVRELHEPMDLIYRSAADLTALAEAMAQLGLPLWLERVPAESSTVSVVTNVWRSRGIVVCRPAPGCPWIALDRRWCESEPPLEPGRRSDLRRAQRNAEKIGPVSSQVLSPAPGELDRLLDEVFRVEAAGWKGREGTALANDSVRGMFYRRYAAAACRQGILRLCFLRIGDRVAAVQLGVESEGRFWLHKIGYDEAFAKCSPGMLLLRDTIRYAASRGLRSYEFLGAAEAWIRPWTDQLRRCVSIRAYPAGATGIAAFIADVLRAAWCKLALRRNDC